MSHYQRVWSVMENDAGSIADPFLKATGSFGPLQHCWNHHGRRAQAHCWKEEDHSQEGRAAGGQLRKGQRCYTKKGLEDPTKYTGFEGEIHLQA